MRRTSISLSVLFLFFVSSVPSFAWFRPRSIRRSVVKIYATIQRENYIMPWQSGHPINGTGTGFIINGRRILTNAHIVSDTRFIQLQKDGDSTRYEAKVLFVGHDCDLAVLTVDDPSFFDKTHPLNFAKTMPSLNDEVFVLGFPMGGTRLSITKGIVSRIDYNVYTHSGVDQHLVIQVDAAINPGNSGGPVIFRNKVAGIAFQGMIWGENIGYGIPLPVINHFLEDIEDGTYHGYPELGVYTIDARNPALREDLSMTDDMSGTVVSFVDPLHSAHSFIETEDVLLAIDGQEISNDGTIQIDGETVEFHELIERKQSGDTIRCDIWRDGGKITVDIPLKATDDPFIYRNSYDSRPRYFIKGGLVFAPLTREYLEVAKRGATDPGAHQILYCAEFAKTDGFYKDRDEFVILTRRLQHTVNTYCDSFVNGIVESVNGIHVKQLSDVKKGFEHKSNNGFHIIRFLGMDDSLVMESDAVDKVDPAIFAQYGVTEPEYLGEGK